MFKNSQQKHDGGVHRGLGIFFMAKNSPMISFPFSRKVNWGSLSKLLLNGWEAVILNDVLINASFICGTSLKFSVIYLFIYLLSKATCDKQKEVTLAFTPAFKAML